MSVEERLVELSQLIAKFCKPIVVTLNREIIILDKVSAISKSEKSSFDGNNSVSYGLHAIIEGNKITIADGLSRYEYDKLLEVLKNAFTFGGDNPIDIKVALQVIREEGKYTL